MKFEHPKNSKLEIVFKDLAQEQPIAISSKDFQLSLLLLNVCAEIHMDIWPQSPTYLQMILLHKVAWKRLKFVIWIKFFKVIL